MKSAGRRFRMNKVQKRSEPPSGWSCHWLVVALPDGLHSRHSDLRVSAKDDTAGEHSSDKSEGPSTSAPSRCGSSLN
jgi:hypothetical protein